VNGDENREQQTAARRVINGHGNEQRKNKTSFPRGLGTTITARTATGKGFRPDDDAADLLSIAAGRVRALSVLNYRTGGRVIMILVLYP
jgi:hypothetical protein